MASDITGTINETVASVLEGKHPHKKIPSCSTLDTYDEIPIFIPVEITEDAVKLVARKISGSSSPVDMDSESIQEWQLKFLEYRKIIRTSVTFFVD